MRVFQLIRPFHRLMKWPHLLKSFGCTGVVVLLWWRCSGGVLV
jgi:hypothetical protein